jgi:hypothetical protein
VIKPTAGARPTSPCTPGRFTRKTRNRGLTPDEPQAARTTTSLATAPDRPTRRLSQTPEPTIRDETANNSDDAPADGIEGDHADQQECQHHQGCAALPVAVGPCVHNSGNADEKCNGEEDSTGLGEPKPVPEPSPIASDFRHARSLGQRNGDDPSLSHCGTSATGTTRSSSSGPYIRLGG